MLTARETIRPMVSRETVALMPMMLLRWGEWHCVGGGEGGVVRPKTRTGTDELDASPRARCGHRSMLRELEVRGAITAGLRVCRGRRGRSPSTTVRRSGSWVSQIRHAEMISSRPSETSWCSSRWVSSASEKTLAALTKAVSPSATRRRRRCSCSELARRGERHARSTVRLECGDEPRWVRL